MKDGGTISEVTVRIKEPVSYWESIVPIVHWIVWDPRSARLTGWHVTCLFIGSKVAKEGRVPIVIVSVPNPLALHLYGMSIVNVWPSDIDKSEVASKGI